MRGTALRQSEQNGFEPSFDDIPGIAAAHLLPHEPFTRQWDAILLDGDQKDRLLAYAILAFTLRPKVNLAALPLHGLILLVGPPGTGKTSLARGLASRTAQAFPGGKQFRYLEVEPHSLANAGLGRSQQAVRKLLGEVIPEHAQRGPLIVLLDEVETLAPARSRLSLEANPVDVHRATDAVLATVDQLASAHPNLLFVATSNFSEAIDEALLSRADLIETIPRPGPETAAAILKDALGALAESFPAVQHLVDDPSFARVGAACQGLDGRQIRKVVAAACTFHKRTALNPSLLTLKDLIQAAEQVRRSPATGGVGVS